MVTDTLTYSELVRISFLGDWFFEIRNLSTSKLRIQLATDYQCLGDDLYLDTVVLDPLAIEKHHYRYLARYIHDLKIVKVEVL